MTISGGRRRWGRDGGAEQARVARDAAVDAFYVMDRSQRDTQVKVDAFTNLDAGSAAATQVRADYRQLSELLEQRAARYIATLDAHPVDEELDPRQYAAATSAYTEATRDLSAAAAELTAFADRFATDLARVDQALDQLAPRAAAAMASLTAARSAVMVLTEANLLPGEAGRVLAEAEQAASVLGQGAGRLGVAKALRQSDQLRALADRARTLAEDLPRRQQAIARRLTTLRTRRDALAFRADGVPAELGLLRRGFVEGCWADLAGVEAELTAGIAEANTALAAGAEAARRGDWDAAGSGVRRAGDRLDALEKLLVTALERRRMLEAVKADPQARMSKVRFEVRDAQRLVMAGQAVPPVAWAGQLDALAARLQRAPAEFERTHPNYLHFLRELEAVSTDTADVVRRYRSSL